MTYNPFVLMSSVSMAPYIPDWTNEAIFLLIPPIKLYVSHQTPQKELILVLYQCYSNCYMIPELANTYSWWQVGSVPIYLKVYQKPKLFPAFMYIQHMQIICGKFHIWHDLVLYQNVNDNDYSTPLLHEALDVDHKMVMLEIGWHHNKFSYLCVQHQHYSEHDTICLYILFYWLFPYILSYQWLHVYDAP